MLLEFSIENTYSIKEKQTISFEAAIKGDVLDELHVVPMPDNKRLLKLACIYGSNASGKSNLLRALNFYIRFIIGSFQNIKPDAVTGHIPFLFSEDTKSNPGSFTITFYHRPQDMEELRRYTYSITLDSKKVLEESLWYYPKTQRKLIFSRQQQEVKWGTMIKGAKKQMSEMTRENISLLSAATSLNQSVITPIFTTLKSLFPNPLITPYVSFNVFKEMNKNEEIKRLVLDVLKSADFRDISDIILEEEDISQKLEKSIPPEVLEKFKEEGMDTTRWKVSLTHTNKEHIFNLPFERESDGTKRFLELIIPIIISSVHDQVLRIDEIESSLHVELLEYFIRSFLHNSESSQFIFTTHILDLMDSDILRDDEIWFAIKNDCGESEFSSITDFTGVRKEVSRKHLYSAGKFGGYPITDGYFDLKGFKNGQKNQ